MPDVCSVEFRFEDNPRELTDQLLSIHDGGAEKRLHDLVPGDWTTVHIFNMETLSEEAVEKEVGYDLAMQDSYFLSDGVLFVFVNDEEIVREVAIFDVWFDFMHKTGNDNSVIGRSVEASTLN